MSKRIAAEMFPASEFLADELAARKWSVRTFAEILGVPKVFVDALLDGSQPITLSTSAKLGRVLDVSPEFFAVLDKGYRKWAARAATTKPKVSDLEMRHEPLEDAG